MPAPPFPPPVTAAPPDAAPAGPPVARTDDVAGDPYRWMEGTDNPERDAWLRAQGEYAAAELAKLPGSDKLRARVTELGLGVGAVFDVSRAGDRIFYNATPAGAELARLMVRDKAGDRVLVDPEALATSGTHYSLHAYSPSPDGKLVAYVISPGGSEIGTLHVLDAATGKDLPDAVEPIWGQGAASWLPDGKSFFYTQLVPVPHGDALANQVAKLHVLGTPAASDVEILPRNATTTLALAPNEWPGLWAPPGTGAVLTFVGGAHSEQRISVAKLSELDRSGAGKTPWRTVSTYADGVEAAVVHGDRIYVQSYAGAPNRRVLSVPLAHPDLAKARVEIPESPDASLSGIWLARDALYVLRRDNGHATILRWPWAGKPEPLALPFEAWAPDLASDPLRDGLVFQLEGWLAPGSYFAYDAKTRKVAPIGLASTATGDFSSLAVDELEATSADGTKVPLTVIHAKDVVRDRARPTVIYAYGAYGSSESPGFSATRLAWIERGGVIAIAHVRGGGERGRRWQDDGSRDKKMNGIYDVIACANELVARGYTSPAKLAVAGRSMGGLLIGRVITEQPDLFAAANVGVGFVNPSRLAVAENGPNQIAELGDPATEAGARDLAAMDPYLHVTHTAYPATIFTVGLHDHRVAPWMTAKMAARMLASSTAKRPILVRLDVDAGHGPGSMRVQKFAELADVWSFFLAAFGDPELSPKT